jgi:prepilin-type processing-associated H-X9-DG protein
VIYPYVNTVQIYHCPADQFVIKEGGLSFPHARSMSMNEWLNPINAYDGSAPANTTVYKKESDLRKPGPANTWVFIDENPDSINDGLFACAGMPDPPATPVSNWEDCPASYHGNAGGLAFADGHSTIKKWTDPGVLKGLTGEPAAAGCSDLSFLESITSYQPPQ